MDPPRSVAAAKRLVGGLSRTAKMPCHSWGIPAEYCRIGGQLASKEGSVCFECYALKGAYAWRTTKAANERRLAGADHPLWVDAMQMLVDWQARRNSARYFRWFDSGDLQSPAMLEQIVAVAERTPSIRHWLPTREYRIVRDYVAEKKVFPVNLTVRLSAYHVDSPPPQLFGLPTSTVHTRQSVGYECPAYKGKPAACMDCRACWDATIANVSYPLH